MIKPVRSLILMVAVFFGGMMTERYNHGERCAEIGGKVVDGLCRGGR